MRLSNSSISLELGGNVKRTYRGSGTKCSSNTRSSCVTHVKLLHKLPSKRGISWQWNTSRGWTRSWPRRRWSGTASSATVCRSSRLKQRGIWLSSCKPRARIRTPLGPPNFLPCKPRRSGRRRTLLLLTRRLWSNSRTS